MGTAKSGGQEVRVGAVFVNALKRQGFPVLDSSGYSRQKYCSLQRTPPFARGRVSGNRSLNWSTFGANPRSIVSRSAGILINMRPTKREKATFSSRVNSYSF